MKDPVSIEIHCKKNNCLEIQLSTKDGGRLQEPPATELGKLVRGIVIARDPARSAASPNN